MALPRGYEFQSEFARKHDALGRARGRTEGRAQRRAEGLAEARAEAVIAVLEARGLPVGDEQRARILGCRDAELLGQWIRRAATVSSASEVFE